MTEKQNRENNIPDKYLDFWARITLSIIRKRKQVPETEADNFRAGFISMVKTVAHHAFPLLEIRTKGEEEHVEEDE